MLLQAELYWITESPRYSVADRVELKGSLGWSGGCGV